LSEGGGKGLPYLTEKENSLGRKRTNTYHERHDFVVIKEEGTTGVKAS